MSHAWLAVTHLDEEGMRKIKEDRAARLISEQGSGQPDGSH